MGKSLKEIEAQVLVWADKLPWGKVYQVIVWFILLYAFVSVIYFIAQRVGLAPIPRQ